MLYKKYHRNFVRQFKEGTKVRYWEWIENEPIISEVVSRPAIYKSVNPSCYKILLELTYKNLRIIDDRGRKLKVEAIKEDVI